MPVVNVDKSTTTEKLQRLVKATAALVNTD